MIGSGMFLTSMVLGLVFFKARNILVNPYLFNKDLGLYLIALRIVIIIGFKKNINFVDSLAFIRIYIINVFLAYFNGKKMQEKIKIKIMKIIKILMKIKIKWLIKIMMLKILIQRKIIDNKIRKFKYL